MDIVATRYSRHVQFGKGSWSRQQSPRDPKEGASGILRLEHLYWFAVDERSNQGERLRLRLRVGDRLRDRLRL